MARRRAAATGHREKGKALGGGDGEQAASRVERQRRSRRSRRKSGRGIGNRDAHSDLPRLGVEEEHRRGHLDAVGEIVGNGALSESRQPAAVGTHKEALRIGLKDVALEEPLSGKALRALGVPQVSHDRDEPVGHWPVFYRRSGRKVPDDDVRSGRPHDATSPRQECFWCEFTLELAQRFRRREVPDCGPAARCGWDGQQLLAVGVNTSRPPCLE